MELERTIEHPGADEVLGLLFGDVERFQYGLNRAASHRASAIADAIAFARAHPLIYALPGDEDPSATAERCAVMEAALRFQLSENAVRNLAFTANEAQAHLPLLWHAAWEGAVPIAHVEAALAHLARFTGRHAEALETFDRVLSGLALDCSPAVFRAKAKRLAEKLAPVDAVTEHAEALRKRTVSVEPDEAGMAWVHLLTSLTDARAIMRRLTSTAKNTQRHVRDGRTRDQIRADLAAAWLKGVGTPTAAKTKVFVTVPADVLSPAAQRSVRRDLPVPDSAPDLNAAPRLDTGETIDRLTAIQLLLEAGAFTRVITDPVTGVILDMDRKARTATRQQREWLLMVHGTCTRDGCARSAAETDIDHWNAFHGPGRGPTDIRNLHPFCSPDNQAKEKTRFRYRRRDDSSVQLVSPTGYATRAPRPGEREAAAFLERVRAGTLVATADAPPF